MQGCQPHLRLKGIPAPSARTYLKENSAFRILEKSAFRIKKKTHVKIREKSVVRTCEKTCVQTNEKSAGLLESQGQAGTLYML
jgi:hypothetical protein